MKTSQDLLKRFDLTPEIMDVLNNAKSITFAKDRNDLVEIALGGKGAKSFDVSYDTPGKGDFLEATVARCRNGVAVNYPEPYMRRRDPETLIVADSLPSDKTKFKDRFDFSFESLQTDIYQWLKEQDLLLLPFYSGSKDLNYQSLLIGPANAGFFSASMADLQGMLTPDEIPENFTPKVLAILAPPFRHTHCKGQQIVVHNRTKDCHELYALNLYPGPSAKKGIYGALINLGEKDDMVTAHGSAVLITTPYDNEFVIMHEGASGGGKSEMLQYPHREPDGRLVVGENILTGKKRYIPLFQGCTLSPITDDMALCRSVSKPTSEYLTLTDAEEGWFVRVNHITRYGVDRYLEALCTNPPEPLLFLNMHAVPDATCLIWEHSDDAPGKPCPNPRVILRRKIVPDVIDEPIEVNVRSFGVRMPPCTKEAPTYGIMGILHILPPSLGWLWRLVSPRGHDNPSITSKTGGMSSEGVGSYWAFATGRKVDQANLLLKQIVNTPRTRYTLSPNQHIGAWKVDFMPQWIAREYMSRRGSAKFKPNQLEPARCALLGYAIHSMQIEGFFISREFLQVNTQEEVGDEGYDKGAKILTDFFKSELTPYLDEPDLDPLGKKIIECCINDCALDEYVNLIPGLH